LGQLQVVSAFDGESYVKRERAYRVIKRAMSRYLLRKRLSRLSKSGKMSKLYSDLRTREGVLKKIVFMRTQILSQLKVLLDEYLDPLAPLIASKEYTQVDLNGHNCKMASRFAKACRKLYAVYANMSQDITKVWASSAMAAEEEALLQTARRMWRCRLPIWEFFNRGVALYQYVQLLKSRDPKFNKKFIECNQNAASLNVGFSSFGGLAMQAKLQSLCSFKEDLKALLKYEGEDSSHKCCVSSALDLVDQLIKSIDNAAKNFKELEEFQALLPITEIDFACEHRKILKKGRVSQLVSQPRIENDEIQIRFETVQLVLMTDCLLVCRTKENDNPNVPGFHF